MARARAQKVAVVYLTGNDAGATSRISRVETNGQEDGKRYYKEDDSREPATDLGQVYKEKKRGRKKKGG